MLPWTQVPADDAGKCCQSIRKPPQQLCPQKLLPLAPSTSSGAATRQSWPGCEKLSTPLHAVLTTATPLAMASRTGMPHASYREVKSSSVWQRYRAGS